MPENEVLTPQKIYFRRNSYKSAQEMGLEGEKAPKKRRIARIIMSDLTGYLKWHEVEKIMDAAYTMQKGDRNRMLIATLAYTGRRISEILKMTPRGIVWEEGVGIFPILKKGVPVDAMLPINERLMIALKEYILRNNIKDDERLFPIGRKMVYVIVRKAGEIAELPKVGRKWLHPHTFRHSFAIEYYRKTHDLNRLSQLLQHTDINMTKVYTQFAPTELREGLDEM